MLRLNCQLFMLSVLLLLAILFSVNQADGRRRNDVSRGRGGKIKRAIGGVEANGDLASSSCRLQLRRPAQAAEANPRPACQFNGLLAAVDGKSLIATSGHCLIVPETFAFLQRPPHGKHLLNLPAGYVLEASCGPKTADFVSVGSIVQVHTEMSATLVAATRLSPAVVTFVAAHELAVIKLDDGRTWPDANPVELAEPTESTKDVKSGAKCDAITFGPMTDGAGMHSTAKAAKMEAAAVAECYPAQDVLCLTRRRKKYKSVTVLSGDSGAPVFCLTSGERHAKKEVVAILSTVGKDGFGNLETGKALGTLLYEESNYDFLVSAVRDDV